MNKFFGTAMLAVTCGAQAATLDTRLSYDSVAKDYIGRIYVGNTWESGFGGSLEAPFTLTSTKYSGEMDMLRPGTTEVVAWGTKRISPALFIRPGLGHLISSSGSTTRPFVTIGYKASPQLDMSLRLRYGRRNFETLDLAKKMERDNAQNVTLWFGYKVSKSVVLEYQLDYIRKVNNFPTDSGRKVIFENEFVVIFPDLFGKGFTPYALIDHLGKSINTPDKSERDHWRPRAGLKIAF